VSPPPLLSKKTLLEFREHLVGWTLRTISAQFDSADIACDLSYHPPVSGERRGLVEQYYRTLDLSKPSDVHKLVAVFENVLTKLEDDLRYGRYVGTTGQEQRDKLTRLLRRDGFEWTGDALVPVGHARTTTHIKNAAATLDAPYLHTQIERIHEHIDRDPRLAIGTAKELVETTCKTILKERGKPVLLKPNILDLVTAVAKELELVPDSIPDSAKASQTIKTLLRTFATIVQGIAELRRGYGTGHGPDGKPRGLQPRHARLAAGAAATLATFLIETYHERSR
jgi:hypothetical protein